MANLTFTETVFTSTYSPTAFTFNYPALTTRFVPASECSNRWLAPGRRPNEVYSTAGPRGTDTAFDPIYSSCQPLSGQKLYSPGVCPQSYSMQTISELHFTSSGTPTSWWAAPCCPTDMTHRLDLGICSKAFTTPLTAFALMTLTTGSSTKVTYIDVRANISNSGSYYSYTNLTTFAFGTVYAEPMTVAWQEKDLAIFPTAYASSLAQRIRVKFTAGASPGSSSVLPSQTSSPTPVASSSSSLSGGAKAGIAVGVVLAVLLAVIPAILLLRRRRRRKVASNSSNGATELEGQEEKQKWYVWGKWRSEAQVESRPRELDAKGDFVPRELEAKGDNVIRGELDSREVHVVPGPPVELDGAEKR